MKNKNIDVDMLLKNAFSSAEAPDLELVNKVKYKLIEEGPVMKKTTIRRSFSTIAAAVMTLVLISTTVFAAWYFLKPGEIADKFGDSTLSAAFESESAININKSVTSGDYTFTLLAIVSGKDITDHPTFSNGEIRNDRTYAVTAIQKADGSPMPTTQDDEYGNPSFYVSPYIKGLKPWQVNAHTMNGGYSEMVENGVMYRILDCDEITMFADRGVYLGINTGSFYDSNAFIYNEQTGELKVNPNYDGSNVVFDLPIDKALADPEKARQYLEAQSLLDDNQTDTGDHSNSTDGNSTEVIKNNKANVSTKRVMTYDEYKAWTKVKLAETQAMVDQGKCSKSSMELDRRDYESNLKEIKKGGTLTMIEYDDGSYQANITYPVDGYSVDIGDDGGVFIKAD